MNLLERIGVNIQHFSHSEREAQAKAEEITTKAKDMLHSGAALTIEAVLGIEQYAAPITALVDRLCVLLQSPVIADDLDMVAGTLGRWGALLTAEFHGHEHKTIGDYIQIFESLFHLNKK